MSQSQSTRPNPMTPDIDSDGSAQTPGGRRPQTAAAMWLGLPVLLLILIVALVYLWL